MGFLKTILEVKISAHSYLVSTNPIHWEWGQKRRKIEKEGDQLDAGIDSPCTEEPGILSYSAK